MADETQNVAGGETRQVKLAPSQQAIEELYVDGVVGMFARAGVIKINLYRVMGDPAKAIRYYEECLQRDPNMTPAKEWLERLRSGENP